MVDLAFASRIIRQKVITESVKSKEIDVDLGKLRRVGRADMDATSREWAYAIERNGEVFLARISC